MSPPAEPEPGYLLGVELFNRGDYFEAHEAWEGVWRSCPEPERLFYQSLIQAAAALYHAGRKNPAGAATLLTRGRRKAAGYPAVVRGLDLPAFWAAVAAAVGGGPAPVIAPAPLPGPEAASARGPDHD